MTQDGRTSGKRTVGDIRSRLAALDAALESLRKAGAATPESLTVERYELSRELATLLGESLISVNDASPDEALRRGKIFVIMPFREPFNAYYRRVIQPAALRAGFDIVRSDEIYSTSAFVQTIWTQILAADAVIAEMSGANPNVLYELGLCHAIDQKVIMITQDLESVPSDLRHMNCIEYNTSQVDWADRLQDSIRRMLLFPSGAVRNTILYPVARVDNTRLFEQLEGQLREASLRAREYELEISEMRVRIDAGSHERNELKVLLGAKVDALNRPPASIHRDGDTQTALLALPNGSGEFLDVVFVPEGNFIFGGGSSAENVWLPSFWISRYSITNAQYCAFLNDVGLRTEQGVAWIDLQAKSPADACRIVMKDGKYVVDDRYSSHPVTYVNFYGASAFCEWFGGQLPTVQQWEKAARGSDGREYPWGSQPPSPSIANINDAGWARDVAPINVRAKKKGMSPYGLVQAIGNVWHWTNTHYPDRNVQAVRGGSFFDFRLGRREVYRFLVQPDGPDFSQGFVVYKRFIDQAPGAAP